MTLTLRLLTVAVFAALAACSGPAGTASSGSDAQSFSIERTACFGFCPMYAATVDADDKLVFEGQRFVAAEGAHEKTLPEGSFERLIEIAERHGFAGFDSAYPNEAGDNCPQMATDMPSVIVSVSSKKLTHAVSFYRGCFEFDGRDRLEAMIEEVDAVLALDDWIGSREDFMGARE